MEGVVGGSHASKASGPLSIGFSTPSSSNNYHFSSVPLSAGHQIPMSNSKHGFASPSRANSNLPPSDFFSVVERPQKRRKIEEEAEFKPIIISDDEETTPAGSQQPSRSLASASTSVGAVPALPFPAHRPRLERKGRIGERLPPRESLNNDTVTYGIQDPPEQAVRYPEGRADYFPWQGNHVEDQLTETGTKHGHFDKVPNLPVETGSARQSIMSALKHKTLFDGMSILMTSTIARRADIATLVSKNTFRPPPRVTLTDTRREAWLKDLADNDIPLRRLSKTIPHGIRGKSLLEQCLAKSIPNWRAIWLIKCVGSNEVRAFRRRGAGSHAFNVCGEMRWMREWTDSVVDFLTSLVRDACDEANRKTWQKNLQYTLKLVRGIYEEQLLDRDFFYEGLVRGFQCSKRNETTAIWMAILVPYAAGVSKFCHRGRQFMDALIEHATRLVGQVQNAQTIFLSNRCLSFITEILRSRSACGILPQSWASFLRLSNMFDMDAGGILGGRIELLKRQNAILCREIQQLAALDFPRPASAVIALCDRRTAAFEPAKLLTDCKSLVSNDANLARTLISWAIDPCRPGLRPIYATVRLLRLMHKAGFDAQGQLLTLLDSRFALQPEASRRLFRLVVELVRSKHFSISKYLQQRMVRGASAIQREHLEILAYLPPQSISPEVVNLASSLCNHAGCTFMVSPVEIQEAATKLDGIFSKSSLDGTFAIEVHAFISELQPNLKHALASHIRKEIASRRDQYAYPSPDDHHMDIDTTPSYAPTSSIVIALEMIEDFPLFADILLLLIPNCEPGSLSLMSRCTVCYRDVFQAIGALDHLLKGIMKRYVTLCQQDIHDRHLTMTLMEMMSTVAGSERAVSILKGHLANFVPENAGIAPSPVSDQMVDSLQSQEIRSLADLENILQSGNVLDEGLLQKMLKYLLRILMNTTSTMEQTVAATKVLTSVQALNEDAFKRMLYQWLDQVMQSEDLRIAMQVVPWLIAGNIVSIAEITSRCIEKASTCDKKVWAASLTPNVFVSTLKPPRTEMLASIEYYYRLRTAQHVFMRDEPTLLASLISLVLEATSSNVDAAAKRARQLVSSSFFESVFLTCLCNAPLPENRLVGELRNLASKGILVSELLARMLKCDQNARMEGLPQESSRISVLREVADKVDDANLIPCLLLTQMQLVELQNDPSVDRVTLLEEAARVVSGPSSRWRQQWNSWCALLADAAPEFVAAIHSRILPELLERIVAIANVANGSATPDLEDVLNQLLSILEATEAGLCQQQAAEAVSTVINALAGLVSSLERSKARREQTSQPVQMCISLLTRLVGMHLRLAHSTSITQDKLTALCMTLCKIWTVCPLRLSLETPMVIGIPPCSADATVEAVLVHVSSLLTDDARTKCLAALQAQPELPDERVEFILGRDDYKGTFNQYLLVTDDGGDPAQSLTKAERHCSDFSDSSTRTSVGAMQPRIQPYHIDRWQMIQDAIPEQTIGDSCLDLGLFGARKFVR